MGRVFFTCTNCGNHFFGTDLCETNTCPQCNTTHKYLKINITVSEEWRQAMDKMRKDIYSSFSMPNNLTGRDKETPIVIIDDPENTSDSYTVLRWFAAVKRGRFPARYCQRYGVEA